MVEQVTKSFSQSGSPSLRPAILTEVVSSIPQSFKVNARLVR